MDPIGSVAIPLATAALGLVGGFFASQRLEHSRQEHAADMFLRTERRRAVARLLAALEDYRRAVSTYALRAELVERGMLEWGPPPLTHDLELAYQEASMLADDGSPLMLAIEATYASALLLPVVRPIAGSSEMSEGMERMAEANANLIETMRGELGVARWRARSPREK